MESDLDLYFFEDSAAVLVDLDDLVPSKPPESQPDSVANAERLMREAAAGLRDKRSPILIEPTGDGRYLILDGNATYGVAVNHGWPALRALIAGDGGPS